MCSVYVTYIAVYMNQSCVSCRLKKNSGKDRIDSGTIVPNGLYVVACDLGVLRWFVVPTDCKLMSHQSADIEQWQSYWEEQKGKGAPIVCFDCKVLSRSDPARDPRSIGRKYCRRDRKHGAQCYLEDVFVEGASFCETTETGQRRVECRGFCGDSGLVNCEVEGKAVKLHLAFHLQNFSARKYLKVLSHPRKKEVEKLLSTTSGKEESDVSTRTPVGERTYVDIGSSPFVSLGMQNRVVWEAVSMYSSNMRLRSQGIGLP